MIAVIVLLVVFGAIFIARKEGGSLFSNKGTGKIAEDSSETEDSDGDDGQENLSDNAGLDSSGNTGNNSNGSQSSKTFGEKDSLPYAIPNTNLQIQKIAGYKGIFIEDGSDKEVSNITAIALKNT